MPFNLRRDLKRAANGWLGTCFFTACLAVSMILLSKSCNGQQQNSAAASLGFVTTTGLGTTVYPVWTPPFLMPLWPVGYGNMAVKTGVLEGVPSEVNVNLKGQADIVFSGLVQNDGTKFIQAGNKLLTELEKHCISMVMDTKTGNYIEDKGRREITDVDMAEEKGKGIITE